MLVKEAAEKYMADKGKRLRASTLEGYRSALELHVLPRWAEVELDAITPEGVQAWVDGFTLPGAAEKDIMGESRDHVYRGCLIVRE